MMPKQLKPPFSPWYDERMTVGFRTNQSQPTHAGWQRIRPETSARKLANTEIFGNSSEEHLCFKGDVL